MTKQQIKSSQDVLIAKLEGYVHQIEGRRDDQISPQNQIVAAVALSNVLLCEILLKLKEGEPDA